MSTGILDTSVVVDLGRLDPTELPDEQAITSITSARPLLDAELLDRRGAACR
jgi:hypothetical protein